MKLLYDINKYNPIDKIYIELKGFAVLDSRNVHIKIKKLNSECDKSLYGKSSDIFPYKYETTKLQ